MGAARTSAVIAALAALFAILGFHGSDAFDEANALDRLASWADTASSRSDAELARQVAALAKRLDTESAERLALREQVLELHGELRRIQTGRASRPEATGVSRSSRSIQPAPVGSVIDETNLGERERLLVRAGLSAEQAVSITRDLDRIALERMNLRYRAAKEGWLDSADYAKALERVPDGRTMLREKHGDNVYDTYLYANMKPNRLVVKGVIAGSPAELVGLRQGDMVISMNGQRIYSDQDLVSILLAAAGEASVPMTIQRGDSQLVFYVPPGPLGIHSGPGYVDPQA